MRLHVIAAAGCLFAAPLALLAQSPRPTVHVIGTGGTIGSAGDYWTGKPSRVPIGELVQIPGMDSVATVSSEQLWNVGSSSIGPVRWLELSRRIVLIFQQQPALAGVVVTHGTDTMEETAYFLDLTLPADRPVVVTGSMRPSNMAGADGPANLMNAVRAVVDPHTRGRGATVLMDDRLFAARDVTKTNSTRVETFQAPERGPMAIVDPEGLFYRAPSPGRTAPQFDIGGITELPRVDIVYSYAGADGVPIDALVAAGTKGIVVAGVGRGGTTPEQRDALYRARAKGVVVVVGTRTGAGRVPGRTGDNLIGTGDLNPQKARVLLTLALTRTSDPAEISRIFQANQ
jgi:L-asparaginase